MKCNILRKIIAAIQITDFETISHILMFSFSLKNLFIRERVMHFKTIGISKFLENNKVSHRLE